MELKWDCPLQNGLDSFFTEESYKKYTKEESFEERFMRHLENWEKRSTGNILRQNAVKHAESTKSKQNADRTGQTSKQVTDKSVKVNTRLGGDDRSGEKHGDARHICQSEVIEGAAHQSGQKSQQYGPTRRATFVAKARVNPPRYSSLKHEEQRQYLHLYQKYYMSKPVNPTQEEIAELNKLSSLQKLVLKEQQEHQDYAWKLAVAQNTCYTYMDTEAKKYIEEKLKYKKKEVELYPFHYNTISHFDLAGAGNVPQLLYVKKLLELGNVPRMVIPTVTLSNRQQMSLKAAAIEEHYPSMPSKRNSNQWNHEVCSLDRNAETLAKLNHAHVVISPGALMCLVDNHGPKYTRDWEIPVTVRDYTLHDGNKILQHRTVYVDRPVISKNINEREKNTKFYKYALKKHFKSHSEKIANIGQGQNRAAEGEITTKSSAQKLSNNSSRPTKVETMGDLFGSDNCNIDDLETFGMTNFEKDSFSKHKSKHTGDLQSTLGPNAFESQSMDDLESFGTYSHKPLSSDVLKVTTQGHSSVWKKPQKTELKNEFEDHFMAKHTLRKDSTEIFSLQKSLSQDSQGFEPAGDFEQQNDLETTGKKSDGCNTDIGILSDCNHKSSKSSCDSDHNETECRTKSDIGVINIENFSCQKSRNDENLDSQACTTVNVGIPCHPFEEKESPASPKGDLEIPICVTEDQESPASPIPKLESPASPIGESPASPPALTIQSPPASPVNSSTGPHIIGMITSPDQGLLETPISPDKQTTIICSPDTRQCKIIPLQGEDEMEIIVDSSQSCVSGVSLSDVLSSGKSGCKSKLRKSGDHAPELKVKVKKRRTTRQSVTKSSDLDTDDDENLIIDWSSQEDAVEESPDQKSKTNSPTVKKRGRKALKIDDNENINKTASESNTKEVKEKPTDNTETELATNIGRVTRKSGRLSLDSASDSPNKPSRRLRSNTQAAGEKSCDLDGTHSINSSDSELQERRSTRSKGQKSNETDLCLENLEKKTRLSSRSSSRSSVSKSDGSEVKDRSLSFVEEDLLGQVNSEMLSQDSQSVCSEEGVVRRKRGRPCKLSIEDESSSPTPDVSLVQVDTPENLKEAKKTECSQFEPTPPKRRRGRPPKVKKETDKNDNTEETEMVVTEFDPQHTTPTTAKDEPGPTDTISVKQEVPHVAMETTDVGKPASAIPALPDMTARDVQQSTAGPPSHTPVPGNTAKKQRGKRSNSGVSTLDVIMQMQEKMLHIPGQGVTTGPAAAPATQTSPPDAQYNKPDHHSNVSYHLWSLGGFQLIIRCGYHGIAKDHLQQLSHIHICPKMEYQTGMGMEQLSPSEVSRSWISAYIRPNCKLLRARIDPVKSELMSVEQVHPTQMVSATQVFNPGNAMLMLQNVFHKLHQLQPGQYLLSHSKGSKECQIKKSTENNKRGTYDLHFQHFGFMATERNLSNTAVPWIPIDPSIIMPHHIKYGRIPATFQPKDFSFHPGSTQHAQKKNKKKRKKNKKLK